MLVSRGLESLEYEKPATAVKADLLPCGDSVNNVAT
jgi:hypothetical protein